MLVTAKSCDEDESNVLMSPVCLVHYLYAVVLERVEEAAGAEPGAVVEGQVHLGLLAGQEHLRLLLGEVAVGVGGRTAVQLR